MPSLYAMTTPTVRVRIRREARTGPKSRRFQRFVVGIAMSVVAFVLERIVVRAMKRSGSAARLRA
jgi:hypothetical protein